ncbi:hypothetical protein [Actinomadura mexicana]|uniref:Uncharacterized protein n=1 Tax=Actinomadura mexicana TaxID=134959 RepID=A0A238UNP7_9ACTN|nr:hypothetical protein [Actinomadura mexicana]SNR23227.1 hypothetical protein SAMN06265355_101120 [Actinomadura mexicana]
MPQDETRVTAEWALWGLDRDSGARGVLAVSGGRFSRGNFAEIVHRYHTGVPAELPQVTIGWTRLPDVPYLTLAIETWCGAGAALTADSVTRVFCVPFGPLARARVSYESLYRAFAPLDPPMDGAATVVLPAGGPGKPAAGPAMGTAATLLSGEGRHVAIEDAGALPMLERLRFLDEVAWLLPYGMRARLSVSTWTRSTAEHRIRLSFTDHAPTASRALVWDRPPVLPAGADVPERYLALLADFADSPGVLQELARAADPLPFTDPRAALQALKAAVAVATGEAPDIETLLTVCRDMLRQERHEPLVTALGKLEGELRSGDVHEKRDLHRKIIDDLGLMADHANLSGSIAVLFYSVLLRLTHGPRLGDAATEELLGSFTDPPAELLEALRQLSAGPRPVR